MKRVGLLVTVLVLVLGGLWYWQQGAGGAGIGDEDGGVREAGPVDGQQADPEQPVASATDSRTGSAEQAGVADRVPVGTGALGQVDGVVVDPLAVGVKGARVTLLRRKDVDQMGAGAPVIQHTRTGERGVFGFRDVEMGAYLVLVRAEGFAVCRGEVHLSTASPRHAGMRLVLTDGEALEGQVVDASGQGVAGAWIVITGLLGVGPETEVRSDVEGRFVFPALPRGSGRVLAWAQGHGLGIAEGVVGAPEPLRVELPEAGPYKIVLSLAEPQDAQVARPADVTVQVRYTYGDALIWLPSPIRQFEVSSEGKTESPSLRAGKFSVYSRSRTAAMMRPWYKAVLTQKKPEAQVKILWEPGLPIQGRLVFADRRPASEVLVQVRSLDYKDVYTAKSDAQGRFAFPEMLWANRDVTLRLASKGYLFAMGNKNRRSTQITPGKEENLCTVLTTSVWRGRVLDEKGEVVAAAEVWLEATEPGTWRIGNTQTDEQGRFEISLDKDFDHPLILGARTASSYCSRPLMVNKDGQETREGLELRLSPAASIEGRVVDDKGVGLPGVAIKARHEPSDLRDGKPAQVQSRWEARRVQTDREGRFRIVGLPPGSWRIEAREQGRMNVVDHPVVSLSRGEQRRGLELVLSSGLSIEGQIVNEAGRPIPRVAVHARFEGKPPPGTAMGRSFAWSGMDGRFVLSGLHAGPYLLSARPSSSVQKELGFYMPGPTGHASMRYDKPFTMRAVAGTKNLLWKFERLRLGEIRARLVHRGAPLERIRVELRSRKPIGIWEYDLPVVKGVLSIPRVVAGSYLLKIGGTRFAVLSTRVQVKPEEITDLGLLTLTELRQVEGQVQDGVGRPVAGVWLGLDPMLTSLWPKYDLAKGKEQFAGRVITESDAQGRFRLPIQGNKRIFAFKPGFSAVQQAWSMPKAAKSESESAPGKPAPLVLRLRRAAELGVQAPAAVIGMPAIWGARLVPIGPGAKPAREAERPAGAQQVWLEAGKVHRFLGLKPGRYRLEALNFKRSTRFRPETVPGVSYHEEVNLQVGTKHVIRIR